MPESAQIRATSSIAAASVVNEAARAAPRASGDASRSSLREPLPVVVEAAAAVLEEQQRARQVAVGALDLEVLGPRLAGSLDPGDRAPAGQQHQALARRPVLNDVGVGRSVPEEGGERLVGLLRVAHGHAPVVTTGPEDELLRSTGVRTSHAISFGRGGPGRSEHRDRRSHLGGGYQAGRTVTWLMALPTIAFDVRILSDSQQVFASE